MVVVTLFENTAKEIVALEVSGHAGYADLGQDIVCSAVSILTINTVNSISQLLGIMLQPESDSGLLKCQFPQQTNQVLQEKMQLLLQAMSLGLHGIEDNYKDFVHVNRVYV